MIQPNLLSIMRIAVIALTVVHIGCASEVHMVKPLTSEAELGAKSGIVVARVVNASGSPLPYNQFTIAPKNLNASEEIKPFRLLAAEDVVGSSTLFTAEVPTGQYSLSSARAFYTHGEYIYSRWVPTDATFGTFDVHSRSITDLGTIVYYPKVEGDRVKHLLVRSPSSENRALVQAHFPFADYTHRPIHGWNEAEIEDDHRSLYVSVVQNPLAYNHRMHAIDGTLYMVGKLGTILARTADGEWLLDAVASDADLNTFARNTTGDMVVGGDHGTLYLKQAKGEWRRLPVDEAYAVKHLAFRSENTLDVILHAMYEVKVVRMVLDEKQTSRRTMAVYTSHTGWTNGDTRTYTEGEKNAEGKPAHRRITYVTLDSLKGTEYLSLGLQAKFLASPFAHQTRKTYAYDPDSWFLMEAEIDGGVDRVIDAGAVKLGVKDATVLSWTGKDSYYRFDPDAQDWTKINLTFDRCPSLGSAIGSHCKIGDEVVRRRQTFEFVSTPVFSSELDALAVVSFPDPDDTSTTQKAIAVTRDGGVTWEDTHHSLPDTHCTQTVPEVPYSLIVYCRGISSDIYESRDQGKTWNHVKQHESF